MAQFQPAATATSLSSVDDRRLTQLLRSRGLWLELGAAVVRVQSDSPSFARQLRVVYGSFPLVDDASWADVHVALHRVAGLRRYVRPQVQFLSDGRHPFEPFPADHGLPMFEWGCNGLLAQRTHHLLMLHAGVVERDGQALVLPAMPGSGKSTLTAALACSGWRLLSDEFGAFDLKRGVFVPLIKPVALKEGSIDVIRRFAPDAVLGPSFPATRKGTVAHLAPAGDAVLRRREDARPGLIILPKWQAGATTQWEAVPEHTSFPALAFNAFNYHVRGAEGFKAALHLVRTMPAWRLIYSDLAQALSQIEAAWRERAQPAKT